MLQEKEFITSMELYTVVENAASLPVVFLLTIKNFRPVVPHRAGLSSLVFSKLKINVSLGQETTLVQALTAMVSPEYL
jgi:hypothetical protein